MYGEAKLAFFLYLWYPKTKVKQIDKLGTFYINQTFSHNVR